MRRAIARGSQVGIDLVVLTAAFWMAFVVRFEGDIPRELVKRAVVAWPYAIALQYLVLHLFGIPRIAWRYIGLKEAQQVLWATATAACGLFALRFLAVSLKESWWPAAYALLPLGVTVINFLLTFLGLVSVRAIRRVLAEFKPRRSADAAGAIPTLLVGAGQGGLMVAKEIASQPGLGIRPIAFIDDDPLKVGTLVHGIPVIGRVDDLASLLGRYPAEQALITISNAPGSDIRRVSESCRAAGLDTKIVPGLHEIMGGKVNLSRIRDVAIEDLLRRDQVSLDEAKVAGFVRARSIVVTGAGGSIGSELCRQLLRFSPRRLLLIDQAETPLFEIHAELEKCADRCELIPCIASVCDGKRLDELFKRYTPEVVFHAAAHKHVPMMERDPGEAIKNNVFGTRTLADLASAHGANVFVMISTDKAVNPTSVMGASKRVAEIYTQSLANRSNTRFVTVRFGNVLGSNGSVIPIFKRQLAAGGPITVTHPEMKRYFMTIPEACQLVLQAGSMGEGGEIFVLDMGQPVRIVDLAKDLIRLSGFDEDEIVIEFSGTRPGEKLFEELSLDAEKAAKTRHPMIFVGRTRRWDPEQIDSALRELEAARDVPSLARAALMRIVPEYNPMHSVPAPVEAARSERDQRVVTPSRPLTAATT